LFFWWQNDKAKVAIALDKPIGGNPVKVGPVDSLNLVTDEIPEPSGKSSPSSAKVLHGRLIPPQQQILLYSAEDWEEFILEWVHYKKTQYTKVIRLSGANDMGVDVAGLCDNFGFQGKWDNYQCKHYNNPLAPGVAVPEIGKMLWHSFEKRFAPPQRYYLMAPHDCGMSLKKLLLSPSDLKAKVIEKWGDWCATTITKTKSIPLEGPFLDYVEKFDFSIFTFKTALEAIDEHSHTPYHAARFGGGLPDRPYAETPPTDPAKIESRYLAQMFEAYGDNKKADVSSFNNLTPWQDLIEHYHRQREVFYHAESLRNFARDTVPSGTFEDLQDEVHAGVVEVEAAPHVDGLVRLNAVTQAAALLPLTANGLISVTKVQDKRGICHQLANDDRLHWKK
jgi:hypothetical protein